MSGSNADRDLEQDLEALQARYRDADELLDERPSDVMRQRLLREAALATQRRARPVRRWPAALAASAITCTFAVLIATHRPPQDQPANVAPDTPTRAPAAAAPAAPAAAMPQWVAPPADVARSTAAPKHPGTALRSSNQLSQAAPERRERPIDSPVQAAKPSLSIAPESAADRLAEPAPAPARTSVSPEPEVRAFAAPPAPAAVAPPPTLQRSAMPMPPAAAGASADASNRAAPPPAWEADPKAWLEHIADLRKQERFAEADRELRRLRERYPDAARELP